MKTKVKSLIRRICGSPPIRFPELSLMDNMKIFVNEFHGSRLKLIDDHDYSGVIRKVVEEARKSKRIISGEEVRDGILALKQYYAVALLDPKNEHAISDRVDPFWHAHILHTKQYARFCDEVFGQFIHHTPLDHEDEKAVTTVEKLYAHTQDVYLELFKDINRAFYPVAVQRIELICFHARVCNPIVLDQGLFAPTAPSMIATL